MRICGLSVDDPNLCQATWKVRHECPHRDAILPPDRTSHSADQLDPVGRMLIDSLLIVTRSREQRLRDRGTQDFGTVGVGHELSVVIRRIAVPLVTQIRPRLCSALEDPDRTGAKARALCLQQLRQCSSREPKLTIIPCQIRVSQPRCPRRFPGPARGVGAMRLAQEGRQRGHPS